MYLDPTPRARWPWWLLAGLALVTMVLLAGPPATGDADRPAAQPPPAAAREPAVRTPPPLLLPPALPPRLLGTATTGEHRFALVRQTDAAPVLPLQVGERVGDYVVTAIEPDRVTLASAAGPLVLDTESPRRATPRAAPPPASPSPQTPYIEPDIVVEGH
jgi:hypothetical protein